MEISFKSFNTHDNDIETENGSIEIFLMIRNELCRFEMYPMFNDYMWTPVGLENGIPKTLKERNICTNLDDASLYDDVYRVLFQSYVLCCTGERIYFKRIQLGISCYDDIVNLDIDSINVWRLVKDLTKITGYEPDDLVFPDVRQHIDDIMEDIIYYNKKGAKLFYSMNDLNHFVKKKRLTGPESPIVVPDRSESPMTPPVANAGAGGVN
jgi:hypothetical protein